MSWWCFLIFLPSLFQICVLSPLPSSSPSLSPQLCLDDERSALLQLKQKYFYVVPYSNFDPLKSWKPDIDCCYWERITCNSTTGHVLRLELSNSSLSGSIHSNSSLFHLHHLQMLNLSYNDFSGQIPSQISQLTDLIYLDLSVNNFGGQIPSEMSQLTNLVHLDLSYNGWYNQFQISIHSIPQLEIPNLRELFQNLSSLSELYLDGVNLSAKKNRGWCHHLSSSLPNLQMLTMGYCSLTGPLDASISNLRFLSVLILKHNPSISSTVPSSLMNLTSLTELNLRDCGLNGDFPRDVFLQPNLKSIDLFSNPQLSVHLPEFPQVNSTLESLGVGNTKFQGELTSSIGNLKSLKSLCLWGLNLSGPIPPALANLTHLIYLDLSVNNFNGEIPSTFRGSFPNLDELSLGNNLLQGPIHSYLLFIPSLSTLDLSYNQFRGFINEPIHNISSSSSFGPLEFHLRGNNLQGQDLMDSISQINGTFSLLDLSFNDFGNMVEDSNNLSNGNFINAQIQDLVMTACNISKLPDFLRNQSELSVLYLNYNRISKFPDSLRELKALAFLDISNNRIDGAIPKWIWQKYLLQLNLSNNFFTGLELPLPNHSNIESLDLHSNMIQDCLSSANPCLPQNGEFVSPVLGNLTSILSSSSVFSISNNYLIGKIPFSICNSSNLDILDLSNNQLSGTIPTCLGSSKLGVLNLESNKLQGPIPSTFEDGCNLQTLKLNKNMLQGKVPRSLGNCKELKLLDIGDNQLNDSFPYWLEDLPELQVLIMRLNKFSGLIPQHPQVDSPFSSLHVIDLSSNNFTGNLPLQYIRHWKAMTSDQDTSELSYSSGMNSAYSNRTIGFYQDTIATMEKGLYLKMQKIFPTFASIDLSYNNFEGNIPDALGNLKALKVLNLSRNSLMGQIPFSFGNFSELESLDLSRNKLSGEIPSQLTSLTSLEVLDLSYNNFTGSIPQGNQFNTFSNASYEGNVGLCGFPLLRKCGALPPMPTFQQEDDATNLFDWIFALAGFCSGLMVGLVIGQQLFWRKNRCSEFISRLVVSK